MARPIVLGNGELHVGLNAYGLVHDLYFPYVGLENHVPGSTLRHHIGVWVEGAFSWLDDGSWDINFSYPHEALIGQTVAKNSKLDITIEFDDTVDVDYSALLRSIHVVNGAAYRRDIRLFMHQAFVIGDSGSNTDTAQYLPGDNALLHYRGRRAFVVSGMQNNDAWFDQYSCGVFGIEGKDGTWRDAEDGELSNCPVEHGRVDSTLRFAITIEPHDSARVHYWIACGTSLREALYVHKQIQKRGFHSRFTATAKYWHNWLALAQPAIDKIKSQGGNQRHFINSLMILKAHMDKRGAIIASSDSSILNYWRDAYAYAWPRDGAYAVWPLIRLGYYDEPYRFFDFCRRSLSPGGYLAHKYRADGALGSSWHPFLHVNGDTAPPIQTDETALVLFVFSQFYQSSKDPKLMHDFYQTMVVPMANFLSEYVSDKTGLPRPSYDIWEERYMTTLYTTAVTCAALRAAAAIAEEQGDTEFIVKWRLSAESMEDRAKKCFYNNDKNAFYRGYFTEADGSLRYDDTLDMSSNYGAFMYGLFDVSGNEVRASIQSARQVLCSDESSKAIARYEGDRYLAVNEDKSNLWPITSLWLAQYMIEVGEHDSAKQIVEWVESMMYPTAVLTEQVDPRTGKEVSVAPLAWSQAEYLNTILDINMEEK